jgi:glycosidase
VECHALEGCARGLPGGPSSRRHAGLGIGASAAPLHASTAVAILTWPGRAAQGNHDNARVATRLGGERPARAALMLLMALPGTPTVYYGEEIGMTNVELRDDQVRDPAALRQPRELWPVVGRDPERTPMQWDASRAAGFLPPDAQADAQPWLPLAPDAAVRNVAAQQRNATSTLALFRTLASLRRAEPALRGAPLVPLDWAGSDAAVPDTVVAFARPLRCACGNVTTPTTPSEPTGTCACVPWGCRCHCF